MLLESFTTNSSTLSSAFCFFCFVVKTRSFFSVRKTNSYDCLGSFHEMISGGSRSTTPTSRKSPAHDVGTQSNQSRNEQLGNTSARDNSRKGPRNKSQQRERKDSTKNERVEQKVTNWFSLSFKLHSNWTIFFFNRLRSEINNMLAINETGTTTVVITIKWEEIVPEAVEWIRFDWMWIECRW